MEAMTGIVKIVLPATNRATSNLKPGRNSLKTYENLDVKKLQYDG